MMVRDSFTSFIIQLLDCLGNWICCCFDSRSTAADELSKGLRSQGQLSVPSFSDDFWSSSTFDMDSSIIESRRSFSSVNVRNQRLVQFSSTDSTHSEFVNHGLVRWNESRLQWVGSKKCQIRRKVEEPFLSWNTSYGNLLGVSKPFSQPVPLSEMVDLLVDVWDQEGLYD